METSQNLAETWKAWKNLPAGNRILREKRLSEVFNPLTLHWQTSKGNLWHIWVCWRRRNEVRNYHWKVWQPLSTTKKPNLHAIHFLHITTRRTRKIWQILRKTEKTKWRLWIQPTQRLVNKRHDHYRTQRQKTARKIATRKMTLTLKKCNQTIESVKHPKNKQNLFTTKLHHCSTSSIMKKHQSHHHQLQPIPTKKSSNHANSAPDLIPVAPVQPTKNIATTAKKIFSKCCPKQQPKKVNMVDQQHTSSWPASKGDSAHDWHANNYSCHWTNWLGEVVEKPNGTLRVCLDPRNLNKAIKRHHHKLPTTEEILSQMAGAKFFSKLNASNAFWQKQLDEESSKLLTFNTPSGRYRLRMPYGIHYASEICQAKIANILSNVRGAMNAQDDIIIWGSSTSELETRTRATLQAVRELGRKLRKDKCQFNMTELTFLGHCISAEGIKPDSKKTEAIVEMSEATNVKELQIFLGMITYLGKFIPNLSNETSPLRTLLEKNVLWTFDKPQRQAVNKLKQLITTAPVLKYYDPTNQPESHQMLLKRD